MTAVSSAFAFGYMPFLLCLKILFLVFVYICINSILSIRPHSEKATVSLTHSQQSTRATTRRAVTAAVLRTLMH